jgi:hypothetical protein
MKGPSPYKFTSSSNKHYKRILNQRGDQVAIIEQMANDTWKVYGMDGKPLQHDVCRTPRAACNAYRKIMEGS